MSELFSGLILWLDQLRVEIYVGFLAGWEWGMFVLRRVLPMLLVLSVIVVGLGVMFWRYWQFKFSRLTMAGVGAFFSLISLQGLLGSSDYGGNRRLDVDVLGQSLMSSDVFRGSIQKAYGGRRSIFLSAAPAPDGHSYVSLNYLGKSSRSPREVVLAAGTDMNQIFPIRAKPLHGVNVAPGHTFLLGCLPFTGNNPVNCIAVVGHYFTLEAQPGHLLKGVAHHGVVRDDMGELWLFQYGRGTSDECDECQARNYPAADVLWAKMADRIRTRFFATPPSGVVTPDSAEPSHPAGDDPRSTSGGASPPSSMRAMTCVSWIFPGTLNGWKEGSGTIAMPEVEGLGLRNEAGPVDIRSPRFSLPKRSVAEIEVRFRADAPGMLRIWGETEATPSSTPRPGIDVPFSSPPSSTEPGLVAQRFSLSGVLEATPGDTLVGVILQWRRLDAAPPSPQVMLQGVSLYCVE